MLEMLAFITPLTHPNAAKEWSSIVKRLESTLFSIEACLKDSKAFSVLVSNHEAMLPPLPRCVDDCRITLQPPSQSVFHGETPEHLRRQVKQLDKGTKVLHGAIRAKELGATYLMVVDADDLVSNRLPGYVEKRSGEPGWYLNQGWVHGFGSRFAYREHRFDEFCGTCNIIRADLFSLPNKAQDLEPDEIRRWYGSHKFIRADLEQTGYRLQPIPFPAAVYRVGHGENNLSGKSVWNLYFPKSLLRSNVREFLLRTFRLRKFGNKLCKEFHAGRMPR